VPRSRRSEPFIHIKGGSLLATSLDDQEQHSIVLSDFAIQEHEVTNAEYRRFNPEHDPNGDEDFPVAYVTWYDAMAYAAAPEVT
jgi:formylglycine-generating enzyme required for sulfatase activity